MAGQNYTWQVSSPNIGTGKGVISSAYNVDGKSPLTTITSSNPDGFKPVNSSSNDPIVSKTEYKIDEDGVITYRYTNKNNDKFIYNSTQEIIDNVNGASSSIVYQIRSAVQSEIQTDARQKNIGQAPIASLPSTAAVPGTGPAGNQVGSKPPPEDTTVDFSNISQINPDKENPTFSQAFGISELIYPTNIAKNGQDFIKFDVIKYNTRKLNVSGPIGVLENRSTTVTRFGSIILPIQPSISDSNNVDWNGLGINPLEMELTNASLNLMSGSGQQYVTGLVDKLQKMGKDKNVIDAVKLYFAQKAAGVEGLLSRVTGATVNPNLELLFQGPTLRPFNFTFRLSPRDEPEATTVRKIIRAFKQYSAVGTASGGLFLTTPNVFNISYHNRGNRDSNHPSLNRIKTCALKSVSVDYTPDGSYMTFSDTRSTMTSYSISLQFQELEPVTTSDYVTDNIPYNEIGY
jgi:hypothetical protein